MIALPSIRSWLADRANVATLVALALITLLAGVLRIAPLPQEPLWLDELHTSWAVVAGIADVAPRARLGNQSPLYFYLPWLTTHLLGPSEFTLRLPSLAAGLALVPLVFAAAVYFSGSRLAGLTAALLVALDQDCIFFAQEARPYAFVQVFAVINAMCFWRMLTAPSFAIRAAWILTGALLFYTHYTAALILVAEGVYLCGFMFVVWIRGLVFRGEYWAAAKISLHKSLQMAFDATILATLCLPALPQLADIFSRRDNWRQFIETPNWQDLWQVIAFGYLVAAPAAVASCVAIVQILLPFKEKSAAVSLRVLAFVCCWCLVPVGVVAVCEWTDATPLFHLRYIIGVLPATILFGVLALSVVRNVPLRMGLLGLLLAASISGNEQLIGLIQGKSWMRARPQNWREAIEFVNRESPRPARVFIYSGLIESSAYMESGEPLKLGYCTLPARGIYRMAPGLEVIACGRQRTDVEWLHSFDYFDCDSGRSEPIWVITTVVADDLITDGSPALVPTTSSSSLVKSHNLRFESRDFGNVTVIRLTQNPE